MSGTENALSRKMQHWVEALTWHETLTEAGEAELTGAVIRDWQTWYANAENKRLFDDLSRLAADVGYSRARGQCCKKGVTEDGYDPDISISAWRKVESRRGTRGSGLTLLKSRLWLSWGSAIAAMAVLAPLMPWRSWIRIGADRNGAFTAVYQTDIGEIKRSHLGDGSDITLGAQTKLSVGFSTRVRSVRLIRGEAWFRVAHDPKWPFVVQAGDGAIRAVGTAFLVTRDSDRVTVTVTEGTVAVISSPPVNLPPDFGKSSALLNLPPPVRVTRGEEVSYRDNGTIASVENADMHVATAWTQGRLVFDDEQLRYVIEDVNRYSMRYISASSAAAGLRFSGVILHNEIQDWLHSLSGIFPVDVDEHGDRICIRLHEEREASSCSSP